MVDRRYLGAFRDPATGEELGLVLVDGPAGYRRSLANPYATKGSQGDLRESDLTDLAVVTARDWRGGRGQEEVYNGDAAAYCDAMGIESRIAGQLTLGPLPQLPGGDYPEHLPGDVADYAAGYPAPERWTAQGQRWVRVHSAESYAMQFVVREAAHPQQLKQVRLYLRKQSGTVADLTLKIFATREDVPAGVDHVGSATVVAGDVTTGGGWVTVAVTMTGELGHGYGWIAMYTGAAEAVGYEWALAWGRYDGYAARYWGEIGGGAELWERFCPWGGSDRRGRIAVFLFYVDWEPVALAQSFTTAAGGMNCSRVQLFLRGGGMGTGTYTVALRANDGGSPAAAVLKSATVDGADVEKAGELVEASWATEALAGSTLFWLTLEPPGDVDEVDGYMVWGGDDAGGYADGSAMRKVGSAGSWEALSGVDLYFRIQGNVLEDTVLRLVEYDGGWYCAAGDTVYKWNSGTAEWDVSDAQVDDEVTALCAWGDWLWAARGSECVLRRYTGAAWADVAGVYARLLFAAGGTLHLTNGVAGEGHKVDITADGTTWLGTQIEVGPGDYEITGMAWAGWCEQLVMATAARLWGLAGDTTVTVYPMLDWGSQLDADNGRGIVSWVRDGAIYIPLRFGLYRYDGYGIRAVGPEQGMGLPAERAGRCAALLGTNNWLYAAMDAGASGISSVLVYNGMGGWSEVARASVAGERIQALGFEAISSPNRLWYGQGSETRFLKLADYSDNPFQWEGFEFVSSGYLDSSWLGSDLLDVVADLHEVVIRAENLAAGRPVRVWYEVDRSARWTLLGEVTAGPRGVLRFPVTGWTGGTIGTGCTRTTIELATGTTSTGLEGGDWVAIRRAAGRGWEMAQVAGVSDADTLTLETALEEVPVSGDTIQGGQAAGREWRLRTGLATDDRTETPRVKGVSVRFQNNVLDRWVFSLQVRVENGLDSGTGAREALDAAGLRAELDRWVERVAPFVWVDPDGRQFLVKATSAGEGNVKRQAGGWNDSVYSINMVEV